MERRHIRDGDPLKGYDALETARRRPYRVTPDEFILQKDSAAAYDTYFYLQKTFAGEEEGEILEEIAEILSNEWSPRFLNVAGWAAAEAALVQPSKPAVERNAMLDAASSYWERALMAQEEINGGSKLEWLHDDVGSYRTALNLAFLPLMKAIVAGDITDVVLERTYADVLAISQSAVVQSKLAAEAGDTTAVSDYIGLGFECNALLTLLFMDDPRHVPLPSTARAGAGYEYPEQTHDLTVLNQHWGDILKVVPIEVKARTSQRDLQRYKSLLIRGKMHLSITGNYLPEHTLEAFRAEYEAVGTAKTAEAVLHATATMRELLQQYQKGRRLTDTVPAASLTRFHDREEIEKYHGELTRH